ncbi:ABC transporter ATP-binding protein [Lysinibacillus sp. CNPSo 3705]|uniref:ABC transporter ATP-binding protein n=1 Tax=Lysinibacillus sp. CNPSo 3705 TaxID=3028148 RepID=UPI002363223A|nr:ABC transporter ATP-binding protein [Lysinibacillus sp. CNPSo 3705]MDD1505163.1 ABC transporter ATP-binding protein [Lysinibacillus sp. CNPSo 3705]
MNYQHEFTNFRLDDINLKINEGEVVSLIGPNGSGKSTLLRVISRLLKPNTGIVYLDERNIHEMKSKEVAKTLTMLPQMNSHQLDLTVRELVEFGRHPHSGRKTVLSKEDIEIVDWAIEVTGLKHLQNRVLPSMSGGERQRAWIAMTVAQHPKVLLLDEPTTYLDIAHQLEVMELVKELNHKYNMTVIMVLHDINQAAQNSERLIVLKKGKIHYDGSPHCVLCKEMFQSIFDIDAEIYIQGGKPIFTPVKLCANPCK